MASGRVSANEIPFRERYRAPNPVASDLARLIGKGASRVSEVAHFDVSQAGETYRVKLKRSAAARRFILRFREATQDLVLTIPARAKLIDAKRFAEKQAPWIGSRLRRSPETLRLEPGALLPLRGVPHKLRLTANVKRMIERLATQREWTNAGQGWQAKESLLRLDGWSRQRRVIILRRRVKGALTMSSNETLGQQTLSFVEVGADADVYEYSVLATSLDEELVSFGQLYRDRGDSENIFDELKNQWGWGGFVTQDLARCQLAARLVALFYDWWNIFVRLVEPDRHMEAITSRPLLLHAIATRVRHARQTTITVASSHARAIPAAKALRAVAIFLRELAKTAEQLTGLQRWRRILARAFQVFLQGRQLRSPPRLAPS